VQAGGDAYFLKPVAICDLIERLDSLAFGTVEEPYRVLIVDDDVELSELHATILQEFGMATRVVNDPLQVLKHMVGFRPDLVLLDMYMPGCNGHELARAIRQIGDYDGIPIVYLSAETSVDIQLDAIRMGGDDFLTKPIRPQILVSSVAIRAERMRIMRTFMARDSLTSLFNLVKTQEQLEMALTRAKKSATPCVYALIELDDLQGVNDKHGYVTGDRVIVVAALLIKRRIRASDVVGRYGGQKFAVIMPDTDADAARTILDAIRESFAKILHDCHHGEFRLTLSGGIAAYPRTKDVAALNSAAGKALAEARGGGRNRIAVAGG
ncbi:MAG TPA: diguanylate cyclase, partial [Desulfuromonadaceae bacterium]